MADSDLALVTGASGFIGGRLVDLLAARGARVRIATSNPDHCGRFGGLPVEIVKADLGDHAALARATQGCGTIFHAAYKFGGSDAQQRDANLDGARVLAQAALQYGARRFVHFSSIAAHGAPMDGDLVETMAPRAGGGAYAGVKRATDDMLRGLHASRGLPVAILQPAIVYGPNGSTWTTPLIQQVRTRRVALPASGLGLCNAVYVDDVAAAALLASEREAAVGETFLISGAAPVTWLEFYRAYATMAGGKPVLPLSDADFDAEQRSRYGRNALLAKIRRKLEAKLVGPARLAARPYLPDPGTRALYASRVNVRIDKAREKLGYAPAFDLARGMAATAVWARAAGLI